MNFYKLSFTLSQSDYYTTYVRNWTGDSVSLFLRRAVASNFYITKLLVYESIELFNYRLLVLELWLSLISLYSFLRLASTETDNLLFLYLAPINSLNFSFCPSFKSASFAFHLFFSFFSEILLSLLIWGNCLFSFSKWSISFTLP